MICVYFLLLSRPGAMIASGQNSFPSEPLSRGDRCLPRVVELETASSAGNLSAHRGAATSGFFTGFVSGPMVDSPARKTDSNSRSLREGKGYGQPLQASIAVSDLNLQVAPPFMPLSWQAQKSISQERDRWFESGSLER